MARSELLASATHTVGAAKNELISRSSKRARRSPGTGAGTMMLCAPTASRGRRKTCICAEW
ncbi:Uncharacterised protein [Mycobacteroides abscessus subsp. abscessus]|nr:Uncharacterised protein [Mycobacteroides abscessus subsp. abscessus]